jgi:hypothetical protein
MNPQKRYNRSGATARMPARGDQGTLLGATQARVTSDARRAVPASGRLLMPSRSRSRRGPPSGKFVMLSHWLLDSKSWRTMSPGPRALYVEIRRRFNGSNNGRITLSHREAAVKLSVHRNTVGAWFRELESRGFITATRGHFLGPSGVGETTHWALDEEAMDGLPPVKKFASWTPEQDQKPRTKNRTPRHKKQDGAEENPANSTGHSRSQPATVLKIVTARG